jgi:MFS family permease
MPHDSRPARKFKGEKNLGVESSDLCRRVRGRMTIRAILVPLRTGRFARYMAGETISMVGTWMQIFAQGWVLTSLTHSALVLGGITFASGIPMLLLTLIGGNFADRFDKRRILYAVLVVQILSATILGWLVATKGIRIWHIFVTATILGVAAAFEVPATAAFVPELVPREHIGTAIALDRSSFHFTRLLGPALGGWLIGRFGTASAYFLNALSFFALIAALLTIGPRTVGTAAEEEQRGGGIGLGVAFVKADRPTRAMILLMAATTLFVSPFLIILMPLYARVTLALPAQNMGVLMGVSGIGSFTGALGLLSIPHGHRATALKCAGAAIALGLSGLAAAGSLSLACPAVVCLALGLSMTFGLANTVIQERTPAHLRGRVSAVAGMSFFGLVPFSGLLVSAGADFLGMQPAMFTGAACFAVCVALLLGGVKRLSSAPSGTPP